LEKHEHSRLFSPHSLQDLSHIKVEKPGLLDGLECLLRQFGEIENRRFASVTIAGCGARNITAEVRSGERQVQA
jgi:hypothetical protein